MDAAFCNDVNPYVQQLSESLDISTLQLQKIMAVISKTDGSELTSEDVAFRLGITVRSANRIMKQLEEKGIAKVA